MITKTIPQLPPLGRAAAAGDKIHLWDSVTGKSTHCDIVDLPSGTGGGGGGGTAISLDNVITIFNTSPNYSYDAINNNVSITDVRLLNRVNYPVITTQFGGGEIRKGDLVYTAIDPADSTKGLLEIPNFELQTGEHITIIISSDKNAAEDLQYKAIVDNMAILMQIVAPLIPTPTGANSAKIWWTGDLADIPAGWQECQSMRGYLPMPVDPDDPDPLFNTIGADGGNKTHTLSANELPAIQVEIVSPYNKKGGGTGGTRGAPTYNDYITGEASDDEIIAPFGGGQAHDIMNPYKVGCWIEFVGLA